VDCKYETKEVTVCPLAVNVTVLLIPKLISLTNAVVEVRFTPLGNISLNKTKLNDPLTEVAAIVENPSKVTKRGVGLSVCDCEFTTVTTWRLVFGTL
jgi:hypothetical protein